jgi:small subunit ribosomal protein S1
MSTERPDESFATLFERDATSRPAGRRAQPGDEVDVVVVQIGKDAVVVEYGGRGQGFIDAMDLRNADGSLTVKVGAAFRARVVHISVEQDIRLVPTRAAAATIGVGVSVGGTTEVVATRVAVGQVLAGTVARVETYGVFMQIDGTSGRSGRGLLPAVEIGLPHGADLRKAFPIGTKLRAKLMELGEDGKMRLSLRALRADEERAEFDGFKNAQRDASAGFGTLGDLLKK